MATVEETVRELEALGTAQNRKIYARHGVRGAMYGVSYANLGKLAKRIKVDQNLAPGLWETGNHDAMVLATMVADPGQMKSGQLDTWARDLDSYVITDAFASLTSKTLFARKKFEKWSRAKGEFVGQAGWGLLAYLAGMKSELSDEFFGDQLALIEAEIHDRRNRVRHAMNMALIAIGGRNEALAAQAKAAAGRIGKVEVDHGQTSCKTPEAGPYIDKMWARKRAKKK